MTKITFDPAKPNSDKTIINYSLPKEGIYFGQSFEDYRAIPAFSRSFAEDIIFDPTGEEAIHCLENPREITPSMELGTAIHSALLEPEDFSQKYISEPRVTDKQFAGKKILFTVEDLKPYLEAFGQKKGGKKEDLIASIRDCLDPKKFVIWDDVKNNFEMEAKISGKKILAEEHSKIISGISEKYNQDQEIKNIFSSGYPEVTLVWKDQTGILCKCRLDYLRHDAIGELKSFSVKTKKIPLEEIICREITGNRYNFQFAIYLDALELLIQKIHKNEAKIYGEVESNWLKLFLSNPQKRSFLVFVRTQAPYQIRDYEVQRGAGSINSYFSVANDMWNKSIGNYIPVLKGSSKRRPTLMLEDHHLPGVMSQAAQLMNMEA